jgi:membrane-associated phospholipid phosphatase
MRPQIFAACVFVAVFVSTAAALTKQQIEPSDPETETPAGSAPRKYLLLPASLDILRDEKTIWKDMFQIRRNEMKWLVPIVVSSGVALSTDGAASLDFPASRKIQEASHAVSDLAAPYPLFAAGVSMYLLGRHIGNPRLRETGILGTQALVHSIIVTGALQFATNRQNPNASGQSEFWDGGKAWPSGHASMFWALSTVVAEQYRDRPLARIGAYSLATAVSISRYTGGVHFPSDALASSVVGYFVGRWIVHHRSTTRE